MTKRERNQIYKNLYRAVIEKGFLYAKDYCEISKDYGYSFMRFSKLKELRLFEPNKYVSSFDVKIVQPIALEFCIAMTEN